jgi:hypothetical protein
MRSKSLREKAFRAGFNAGMEYMSALEFAGDDAIDENAAWVKFVGENSRGKYPAHQHVPTPARTSREPHMDLYWSQCIICGRGIRATGIALAAKRPDAWLLDPLPPDMFPYL